MEEIQKPLELNWNQEPKESNVLLYNPDKEFVCEIKSALDFTWVRLQIAQQKLKGYYFNWEGKSYDINPDGSLPYWPGGLFTEYVSLVSKLLNYKLSDSIREKANIPASFIIDINKCPKNDYVNIYDNEDKLICHTNDDLQFTWVRAQIKEKGIRGCYLIFRDQKIRIDERGELEDWPQDLFDNYTDQLIKLV